MRPCIETPAKHGEQPDACHRCGKILAAGQQAFFVTIVLVMAAMLAIPAGLAAKEKGKKKNDKTAPVNLVWPAPPQRPRIRYLGLISSPDDVKEKKKSSLLDRVAGVKRDSARLRLQKPYGIAVDSLGRIFVADPANRIVFVFDQINHTVDFRGNRAQASFGLPMGLAIDEQDRLFVSDSHFGQITCFDPEGGVLAVFGHDVLQRPAGMALDRTRHRLYVADAKAHRVAMFDTVTFQSAGLIGGPTTVPEAEEGKFTAPTNVAVDHAGLLYVTDTWNHRIQIFNPRGKFLRTFGKQGDAPGMFARPKGVAIDSEGHVYVADAEFNNIQVFSSEGQPLLVIGGYGSGPGQFTLISGLAFDHQDRLYAAEQWAGRVQIFQYLSENAPVAQATQ